MKQIKGKIFCNAIPIILFMLKFCFNLSFLNSIIVTYTSKNLVKKYGKIQDGSLSLFWKYSNKFKDY